MTPQEMDLAHIEAKVEDWVTSVDSAEYSIEDLHGAAVEGERLRVEWEAAYRDASRWRLQWDVVLLLVGGTAVTLSLIAALGYFSDGEHVHGWWMVLAAIFALSSSVYAIQKTKRVARHQWDLVLLLVGGIAVTNALIAALGYYWRYVDRY